MMSARLKAVLDDDGWLPLDDAELSAEWVGLQDRGALVRELALSVFSWRQCCQYVDDPGAAEDRRQYKRLFVQIVEELVRRGELCGLQTIG